MIKKTLLGVMTLLFVSCGADHKDFSGDWIDKKSESDRMIIKKNGDNYIVQNREKKYPAQIKDGLLEISTERPLKAAIDNNDNLILGGKEYIRYEKSTGPKFEGNWITEEEGVYGNCSLSISIENGLSIKITKAACDHAWFSFSNPKYDNGLISFIFKYQGERNGDKGWIEKIDENKIKIITVINEYKPAIEKLTLIRQ